MRTQKPPFSDEDLKKKVLKEILINLKKRAKYSKEKPDLKTAWFSQEKLEQAILETTSLTTQRLAREVERIIDEWRKAELGRNYDTKVAILKQNLGLSGGNK